MRRSEQRRAAVIALYQHDLTGRPLQDTLPPAANDFVRALAAAAIEHRGELDELIDIHAHGWSVEVGGGRDARQSGQVRKEAAVTNPFRVAIGLPLPVFILVGQHVGAAQSRDPLRHIPMGRGSELSHRSR